MSLIQKLPLAAPQALGVISQLNDPAFQMIQPIEFGGEVGTQIKTPI